MPEERRINQTKIAQLNPIWCPVIFLETHQDGEHWQYLCQCQILREILGHEFRLSVILSPFLLLQIAFFECFFLLIGQISLLWSYSALIESISPIIFSITSRVATDCSCIVFKSKHLQKTCKLLKVLVFRVPDDIVLRLVKIWKVAFGCNQLPAGYKKCYQTYSLAHFLALPGPSISYDKADLGIYGCKTLF